MFNDRQIDQYLRRINFTGELNVDVDTLDELTYRHQCTVPFETIGVHRRGKEPRLALDVIFEKAIIRELGGYCFELNKLFEHLLVSVGFKARPALSRAVRGRDGRMPINHRGIIVTIDGRDYSADVGFGGPMPAGCLLLENGVEQTVRGEIYIPSKNDRGWWNIDRVTRAQLDNYDDGVPERRQTELDLCDAHVEDIDFDALNLFFSQPGTLFRDHEIVNLRTEHGYAGYKDGVLTTRSAGVKTEKTLSNKTDQDEALFRYFGLKNIDRAVEEGF